MELLRPTKTNQLLHEKGIWKSPRLLTHINKQTQVFLENTFKILAFNLQKQKRKKALPEDFDTALNHYKETHLVEMVDGICDRLANQLEEYKKEVQEHYDQTPKRNLSQGTQ